jgi:superfamily II DNA or RNA helicase
MNFYSHDGMKRKGLGFCVSIDHAKYMAAEFNRRGYKSICLSGDDSVDRRTLYVNKLENDHDSLEFIFTVDIFNEGVDIPSVNTVLMLRPTNSLFLFSN